MSKLTFEDKINIYNDKQDGKWLSYLCQKYNINSAGIKYFIRLINKHGFKILRTNNNKKFNKNNEYN